MIRENHEHAGQLALLVFDFDAVGLFPTDVKLLSFDPLANGIRAFSVAQHQGYLARPMSGPLYLGLSNRGHSQCNQNGKQQPDRDPRLDHVVSP